MIEREIEQGPTNVVARRVMAMVLTNLVVVAVPAVLIAWRNPWHYVHLMPFGRSSVVASVLFVVPALLGMAAWLVLRPAPARAVAVVATVLALVMAWGGFQFRTGASLYGYESDGDIRVVAVSPGGSFELVLLHYPAFMTGFDILRIRSRAGLRSREANQDLACFATPFDPVGPEGTFGTAHFLSDHEIEVRTEAGQPWTTRFDPRTLLVVSTLASRPITSPGRCAMAHRAERLDLSTRPEPGTRGHPAHRSGFRSGVWSLVIAGALRCTTGGRCVHLVLVDATSDTCPSRRRRGALGPECWLAVELFPVETRA
ncbi:hypothetical protein [Micromonospora sp. 4G55]|uniref:hypothetical protein n=1 Tax=Micromonospora sp. 4G55 TaxID=2806102 RepID=UPI001A548129|nr:hypothetical protein [Micromonospora sp. 4G55]MBM0259391.1 hypothetical protein [Micromonospora sp. 4G55]